MATFTDTISQGTTLETLLSTELNSMASSSSTNVLGSAVTPTDTGCREAELELKCAAGSNMTVNTPVYVWFLRPLDGTNYEDGGTSVTPLRNPDAIFSVRAATSQRITKTIRMPVGTFKTLIQQQTGQTWSSSGNTLTLRQIKRTSVGS